MPFMSFFTLLSVAVVPLAAALYVVTSTTWSAVERALLYPLPTAAGASTGTGAGAGAGKGSAGASSAAAAR
jgi:YidC/Oxa1 family membrane protein insertase